MKYLRSLLAIVPVCACLTMASLGAVLQQAPTLGEVNAAMDSQDFGLVEDLCREIVAEDSSNAQAWFLLGYGLHAQGEIDEAILVHLKATTFPQTAPLATYNLGCAHALKGNTDQAFTALNKAVGLGMSDPQQYSGDTDLKALQNDARWGELIQSMQPRLSAQSTATNAPKAELCPADSALHFWVGEWDCYSAQDGNLVGRNILEFRAGTNAIHESWKSEGDSYAGEAWAHYDPRSGTWKQIWTGANGDLAEYESDPEVEVDGLYFVGSSYQASNGKVEARRMHLRRIGEGRLRHTGMASDDNGATWIVKYDLIYVPRGEAFELEDMSI